MSGLEGIPVERDPWLRARERQRLLFLALVDDGFDAAEMAAVAERSCGMRLAYGTAARWLALAPNRPGWARPLRAGRTRCSRAGARSTGSGPATSGRWLARSWRRTRCT